MSDSQMAAALFAAPFLLLSLIWAAHDTYQIAATIRAERNQRGR